MKLIQIITSYPIHREPVIKNRLDPFIEAFLSSGYRVNLISNDNQKMHHTNKNFTHSLVPMNFKMKNFILRSVFELKLALKLIKHSRESKSDLVFVTIPSIFLLFFIFKLKNKKLHLDIRDLVWEYVFKNKLILKIIEYIIRKNFKFIHSISYTNKSEFKSLSKYNFDSKKTYYIPNGVSKKKFNELKYVKKSESDKPTVSYIGNVGIAQNLETLIKVAKLMSRVNFNIVGDGIDLSRLINLAKKNNLSNLKFTGQIDWKGIIKIYDHTDILFLQLNPDFKTAFPSKLYEYISVGKLIIFAGGGDVVNDLQKFDNIIFVEYENYNSITEIINNYICSQDFKKISFKNRKLINQFFIRENSIENFLNSVKKI